MNRRQFLKASAWTATAILTGVPSVESSMPTAELILINGKIITLDARDSMAEAIAVRGGKILAVGPTPQIKAFAGGETAVIDLQGKTVTPGLIDAHAHLPPFGMRELFWVNLQGLQSKDQILERIAARAKESPPGKFINAWGVESHHTGLLTREDLDDATSKHPVLAVHTTGQWGVANSLALKMAGVDGATKSPPGSWVEKRLNGQPSGLLVHYPALYLVRRSIPPPTAEQTKQAILHAATLYSREGVTSIHDNFFMVTGISDVSSARLYFDLAASGQLPVRLKIWPYLPTLAHTRDAVAELFTSRRPNPASPFHGIGKMKRADPESFARVWGGLKIAVDGSGPTSGWYGNPNALMLHSPEELHQMADIIHRAGQQVSVHAVGDRAVDTMLDAFEAAQAGFKRPDPRHRIEHAILPSDIAFRRLSKAGVVVCTHPQFIYPWGKQYRARRGPEFIPLHTYLDHGVKLAFGADPPAFAFWQPQYALWQAVARVTAEGRRFNAGESIPIRQALRIQSMGSAYAGFQEREAGSLEPGKLADMAVWDRNFLTVPTEDIRQAKAVMTILGGKIVHRSI